jgi:hypothetical protein
VVYVHVARQNDAYVVGGKSAELRFKVVEVVKGFVVWSVPKSCEKWAVVVVDGEPKSFVGFGRFK